MLLKNHAFHLPWKKKKKEKPKRVPIAGDDFPLLFVWQMHLHPMTLASLKDFLINSASLLSCFFAKQLEIALHDLNAVWGSLYPVYAGSQRRKSISPPLLPSPAPGAEQLLLHCTLERIRTGAVVLDSLWLGVTSDGFWVLPMASYSRGGMGGHSWISTWNFLSILNGSLSAIIAPNQAFHESSEAFLIAIYRSRSDERQEHAHKIRNKSQCFCLDLHSPVFSLYCSISRARYE